MASNQPTFSSGTPHFFKIVLQETLQENKLRIPEKFVKKYGETLSDSMYVKVPSGSEWKMKLRECYGKLWLENGWLEFKEHYSIGRGHMLMFRYEGNSKFQVVIFDRSTMEIDYTSTPIHFDESDDSVETLVAVTPCSKTREKSPLPCFRPRKRTRTNPTGKTRSNLSPPKLIDSHRCTETRLENSMSKGNPKSCESKMKGKRNLPAKSGKDKSINARQGKFEIHRCVKQSTKSEKLAGLQKASNFKSNWPFFKVLMQPCYVHRSQMNVPLEFAGRYIKNEGDVVLRVPNGGSWSAQLKIRCLKGGRLITEIRNGWKAFAQDNNLEVRDICIFELKIGTEISFEVSIVRVSDNAHCGQSQGESATGQN